jgi:hypothetical protein
MLEEDIELLQSQGYTYSEDGYILDSSGKYVSSIEMGGKILKSPINEADTMEVIVQEQELKAQGYEYKSNLPESNYVQKQKFNADLNLRNYLENPDEVILDKSNPSMEASFKRAQEDGLVNEYTMEALESNFNDTSNNPLIQQLANIDPNSIDDLKKVKQRIREIEEIDNDYTSKWRKNAEDTAAMMEENSWYNPENITYGITKLVEGGISTMLPVGFGMDNDELKQTYQELKKREKELLSPAIDSKLQQEKESLKQSEEQLAKWLETVDERPITDTDGAALEYMNMKKRARIEQLEDYLTHDNQNWFMKNLYNPIALEGGKALRNITWAETAHSLGTVRAASVRFNNGEATEQDKITLNDYAEQLEHEEFMGSLPSLGALHDTAAGVTASLGFMGEMSIGGGVVKKGGKKLTTKLGAKYLDDVIFQAMQGLGRAVPASIKPVAKGVIKNSYGLAKELGEAAIVPLGMSTTYSGTFETLHPIIRDEEGKILMEQDAYQYEMSNLTGQLADSNAIIAELTLLPSLTEEQKEDLQHAMSFVGVNESIHGVKRNKAVPTYQELTKDLKPVSVLGAFYESYTQQVSEVASEKLGSLGIGKGAAQLAKRTKVGTALLDNKITNALVNTSENVNKFSGGYVHSIFDEMLEENLVPVLNYVFQGKQSELHSMLNLDAQKDVAIQTVAMNMLFRVPGAVQDNFTAKGRENKKWREEQKQKNKDDKDRLSTLYNNIATLGVDEDLSKIIDLTSIPGASNQKTQAAIKILEQEGKVQEAANLRNSLFDQNAITAIRTGTVDKFDEALSKLEKYPTTNAETRASVAQARITLKDFAGHAEKYGGKFGGTAIVENLMNRDVNKRALKASEQKRQEAVSNNSEEFNLFEKNFERKYRKFIAERQTNNTPNSEALEVEGPVESMHSGVGYLNKRFEDAQVQADYAKLLMESTQGFSPELHTVVNETVAKENSLRESIFAQDKVHIELTSARKQAELRAKDQLASSLVAKALQERRDLTPEEVAQIQDSAQDLYSNLSAEDLAEVRQTVSNAILNISAEEQAKRDQQAADLAVQSLANSGIDLAAPVDIAPIEPEVSEAQTLLDLLNSDLFTSGVQAEEGPITVDLDITNTSQDNPSGQPFSPREFDANKLSEERKGQLINATNAYADYLKRILGREPTFEDMIKDRIAKSGETATDDKFETFKHVWELSGRDISKANEVYDSFFNAAEVFENLTEIASLEAEQTNTQAVETAVVTGAKVTKFDERNQPVTKDTSFKDGRTTSSKAKASHLGVQYDQIIDDKGNIIRTPSLAALNKSQQITNHDILNPDVVKPGMKLTIKIPDNVNDLKVADWTFNNQNIWVKTEITFGDWVKKHGHAPGSIAYNDKIPMIAYSSDGRETFFIHDTEWYNTSNVGIGSVMDESEMSPEDIKDLQDNNGDTQKLLIRKGKQEVSNVRANVLNGNRDITIEERRFGNILNLMDLKTNNEPITLSEATGNTMLAVASDAYSLVDSSSTKDSVLNDDFELVNNTKETPFIPGVVYEMRHVNTKADGTKQYIALRTTTNKPSESEKINEVAFNNVKFSVISSIILNNSGNKVLLDAMEKDYGMTLSKAQHIQSTILSDSRIDIKSQIGEYMTMFAKVDTFSSAAIKKLQDTTINPKTGLPKYPNDTNYIAVDNNTISISLKNGEPIKKNKKGFDTVPGIPVTNVNPNNTAIVIGLLHKYFNSESGDFRKTQFDISKGILNQGKKFSQISDTGVISDYTNKEGKGTYEDYVKDNLKTTVKSFPIQDKNGNTQWVTDIQPMVYYGLSKPVNALPLTTKQKIEQAVEKTKTEINPTNNVDVQSAIDALPQDLKDSLGDFNLGDTDYDVVMSRREFDAEASAKLEGIQLGTISSLSPLQQKKLVNSLFNLILGDTSVENSTISLTDISSRISSAVETYLGPKILDLKVYTGNLKNLGNPAIQPLIDKFEARITQLETVIAEQDKLTSRGSDTSAKGELYKKFERFLSEELTSLEETVQEEQQRDNGEIENNFSASALEKDVKLSFSNSLKVFFSNIKKQKKDTREDIVNFAQLNDYENVDDIKDYLSEVMIDLPSSISVLIDRLEAKKDDPVYNQILNKIKSAPENIQNEILYKMIQSKLDMHMVLYSFNKEDSTYTLKVINPNSGASNIKMEREWYANFKNSDLFKTVEDERAYNSDTVKILLDKLDALSKLTTIDDTTVPEIKEVLISLGITVSDNTIEALVEKSGVTIMQSSGILGVFNRNLMKITGAKGDILLEKDNNNPFKNAKGVLEDLMALEIELNGGRVAKSFRVDGKTIQGAIQKMMIYDVKENLRNPNSTYFKDLKQIAYSKGNYLLNLMETNRKFRNNFDVGFISLEAIKEHGKKKYGDRKINKLAETDNMLTQISFFQNTAREIKVANSNLKFRMGQMFNPALSDKEQMLVYTTALLDLSYKDFTISKDIQLSQEVVQFVTGQIFDAEFDRIIESYNTPTDIKNYDGAAKRFIAIPELNNIKDKSGADIHSVIQAADLSNADNVKKLKAQFVSAAEAVIRANIDADVKNKMEKEWVDAGFIEPNGDDVVIKYFDSKYLSNKREGNTVLSNKHVAKISAYDFVVNQYLNQNNVYQLMSGDMALYAPSLGRFTKDGVVDNVAFSKAVGESISKRMAMLIAPGNKLANSDGDTYLQLMVQDPVKITSSAKELIKQYYGTISEQNNKDLIALDRIENQIQSLYDNKSNSKNFDFLLAELNSERGDILKRLKSDNPEIGGYFDIEGTDAQEYTTWKEHLDILSRQGRLTSEEKGYLKSAYEKLSKGEPLEGKELSIVMNPIKPVYAGSNTFRNKDGNPSVNRVVYIKTSSLPLLPQLTKDFKLDAIRKQLEGLQEKEGKNVRLAYQSGIKVGSIDTKLTTDDLYNIPFEELHNTKLRSSMLELDRNNFKIQQDTPYKTDKFLKKNSEDMTTMGSQMWKILLGNGINKIDRNIFPQIFGEDFINEINNLVGKKIIPAKGMVSGKDLDVIKFHAEKMYFDAQKELLFDELGIDRETRSPKDLNKTIELLHRLLEKETTTRQYPEGIVDNLKLISQDGNLEFLLPLWLSNGSNKFESLLQSIITNRLIKISLPGNQLISSSSEGFVKTKVVGDTVDNLSGVVWADPNHTGELKATRHEDGSLKEAEVLMQSKFRKTEIINGKKVTRLIDLTKAPYSVNGVLNKELIDDELLSNFSFRIPTSSHQSGAILKVVGFLPEASGDMLVVPKEHTQQLGEDFDIDKRTLYKSNYTVDETTGKISKINFNDSYKEIENKKDRLRAKIKMLENVMVDVYKSVYQSPDSEVQKKINKILSFDNATNTANAISGRVNSSSDDKHFSLFSDTYQRAQMKLGADGKTGIGVHSNAVTLQAQMERLDNKIVVQDPIYNDKGKVVGYENRKITIGGFTSDGVLGISETLDGTRSVGDVHTENQNSSTDNIKAQIMGKRNENSYTMNILTQLTYRRFDLASFKPRVEGHPTSIQISSLFISQPILRRYVELKERNKSITSTFDPTADNTIIETLIAEFGGGITAPKGDNGNIDVMSLLSPSAYATASARMTGDVLYDNLLDKTAESDIQLAVLQTFFVLEAEAKHLGKYQSLINLSTSGLGISYFNVLDRVEALNDMGYEASLANVRDLVGDFIFSEDFVQSPPADANEYTKIGDFYIKPTTTEGTVLVQSVSSAEDIMDVSFPYKQSFINRTINRILEAKGKELGKDRKNELQYRIINSIRDFLYAKEGLGLFQGDVNSERKRLFFDTKDNQSLASYLKNLRLVTNHPIMQSNELLKSLAYDKISNTKGPSIIQHQTDANTNFDKTDKYNSFLELMKDDVTELGTFNGEVMTPRKLAQELASYAYLANNENGAIGFKDFIHSDYLDIIGVSENIRNINNNAKGNDIDNIMQTFEKQFYQHNPEEATIMSPNSVDIKSFKTTNPEAIKFRNLALAAKDVKSKELNTNKFFAALEEFVLESNNAEFISVRDTSIKLSDNQFRLFNWDGEKYVRIPVLGTFGFSEYNPSAYNQTSLIYPEVGNRVSTIPFIKPEVKSGVDAKTLFDVSNGLTSLLEQININPEFAKVAQSILPFIDPNTKIVFEAITLPSGEVLKTGMYQSKTNTIFISPQIVDNIMKNGVALSEMPEILEEVILEEILHSITYNQVKKFGEVRNGIFEVNPDAPIFIQKLVSLYDVARKELPYNSSTNENYYTSTIFEFIAGVFVSDDLKQKLDSIDSNGKSLLDKFKDAVASMVRYLTGGTYSSEVKSTIYELLDYEKNSESVLEEGESIINSSDVAKFNTYLSKSNGNYPEQFFTPDTKFAEFYNNATGKRERAPQSSSWHLNENMLYDLLDQDTGKTLIENVDLKTGIKYTAKQVMTKMKEIDTDIDAELNKIIKPKAAVPTEVKDNSFKVTDTNAPVPVTPNKNNLKAQTEYTVSQSALMLNNFDKFEVITVTPASLRQKNTPEFRYVADLINHIEVGNNVIITGGNILNFLEIETINPTTQTLKKKIDLGAMLDSSLFTSGGADPTSARENRLPVVKKCK